VNLSPSLSFPDWFTALSGCAPSNPSAQEIADAAANWESATARRAVVRGYETVARSGPPPRCTLWPTCVPR
jgi:hypothetical protein